MSYVLRSESTGDLSGYDGPGPLFQGSTMVFPDFSQATAYTNDGNPKWADFQVVPTSLLNPLGPNVVYMRANTDGTFTASWPS